MNITLWDIIARVESNNHLGAIRFEPDYYAKRMQRGDWVGSIITRIREQNKCSLGTARMIYCSSFGAVQVMGFNLYHNNTLSFSVAKYLNDEALQVNEFRRFLKNNALTHYTPELLKVSHDARIHFAKVYNGAVSYAELLNNAINYLGVK